MSGRAHIVLAYQKCQAAGRCAAVVPEIYNLDDEGKVALAADEVDDSANAVRGARACPYRVITVSDSATGQQLFPPAKKTV